MNKERPSVSIASEREIKVVVLGEAAVGKSSIVLRFVTGNFRTTSLSTIGASFMSKMVILNGETYKYQIWDTAGQEKYRSLASMYYKGAEAAILVYDITSQRSFERIQDYWVEELRGNGPENIILTLAGNKCDLESDRAVSREAAEHYAKSINANFLETSAKTENNISEAFTDIGSRISQLDAKRGFSTRGKKGLKLTDEPDQENNSWCC